MIFFAATAVEPVRTLIGWVVLATLLLLLAFALVWRLRTGLLAWIDLQAVQWTKRISSERLRVLGIRQIRQLARILVRLVSVALALTATFTWLVFVLQVFPSTQAWSVRVNAAIIGELDLVARSALSALPGLGVIAVLFFLTRVVHELVNHYFRSIEDGEVTSEVFDAVTAEVTRRLVGAGLWVAAIIIAYPYIPGSDSAAFKGVSLLAGLMVSLGSTSLVGQMVSGLMIIYSHAVRPGDWVEVGEVEGKIERLGLFSCGLRTVQAELIILPNSKLAAGLKNYSRSPDASPVRFLTEVTIGYDTPWRQVRDLLLAAAADVPGVRPDPAPFVRQAALEDFYVRYELVFAPVEAAHRRQLLSDVHEAIQDRFQAAGVQIMSPHYENDPATAKVPRSDRPGGA